MQMGVQSQAQWIQLFKGTKFHELLKGLSQKLIATLFEETFLPMLKIEFIRIIFLHL
jgi:hypothetical protein